MAGLFNFSTIEKNELQKSQKNKMTEGVIIARRIFEKIAKKIKLKSQDSKTHNFWTFSDKFTKNDVT